MLIILWWGLLSIPGCSAATNSDNPSSPIESLRATNEADLQNMQATIAAQEQYNNQSTTMTAETMRYSATKTALQATIQALWTSTPQPTERPTDTPLPARTRTRTPVPDREPGTGNGPRNDD